MLRSAIIAATALSVAVPTAALAEVADALAAPGVSDVSDTYEVSGVYGAPAPLDDAAIAPIPALAAWSAAEASQADAYALAVTMDDDGYANDGTYGPVLPAAEDEGLGTGEKVAIGAGVIVGAALVVAVVGYVLIASRDWEN